MSSTNASPGSNRSFGIVFTLAFIAIALYPLFSGGPVRLWSLLLALTILLATIIRPSLLSRPNQLWFRFGLFLGGIVAPIVMGLVYITTIIPIGLIVRISGKDLLRLRFDDNEKTYWITRDTPPQPMKNQF